MLQGQLHCENCGRDYPITDGIPNMITEESPAPIENEILLTEEDNEVEYNDS